MEWIHSAVGRPIGKIIPKREAAQVVVVLKGQVLK
jgi:hypothetical protein